MPKFRITSPDGQNFDVEGPEGSTQEQALAQVQAQYKQSAKEPGLESVGTFDTLFPQNKMLSEALDRAAYKAGGAITDVTGSPAAGYLANVFTQAAPNLFGGQLAKGAAPVFEWTAKALMQSAIKPSSADLLTGKAARAVGTLLDEGINPTVGGMNKLRGMAETQNAKVADLISQTGGTVSKPAAASRIQDTVQKVEAAHPIPEEVLPSIEKVYTGFMKNGLVPKNIPVEQAQTIKQEIYRMMKYGELKADLPKEAAYKALGRGLKEELEASVPGVKALNAKASELWNALDVSERRALLDLNRNPLNIGVLAHSPMMFATYMADKSAAFKGLIARGLYAGKEQLPATAARLGIARYQAIQPQQEDAAR